MDRSQAVAIVQARGKKGFSLQKLEGKKALCLHRKGYLDGNGYLGGQSHLGGWGYLGGAI